MDGDVLNYAYLSLVCKGYISIYSSHILLGYKSGDRSLLADYSIKDKTSVITALPAKTYFIDPMLCDHGLIRFTYLETQGIDYTPLGLLNLKTGCITRVRFDNNYEYSVRNGQIASYLILDAYHPGKSTLSLYDTNSNTSVTRGTIPDYPGNVASSPDGKTIVYSAYANLHNVPIYKFYLNKKK